MVKNTVDKKVYNRKKLFDEFGSGDKVNIEDEQVDIVDNKAEKNQRTESCQVYKINIHKIAM